MVIEQLNNEIIIKIKSTSNIDDIQNFANYLGFVEITNKSKAKDEEIDDLITSTKNGMWERTKKHLSE
jgi:ribosomal 30S subunit maturation factor RimM